MDSISTTLNSSQGWSWKICALIAAAAVTLDLLLVQYPLVWLCAAALSVVLAQFRSPMSGLAVVIFTCGLLNYSPFQTGALSRVYPGNVAIAIFLFAWLASNFAKFPNKLFPATALNRPLLAIALLTPISMLWSRLHPDPDVTYAYPHSDISWSTAQISQLFLLVTIVCLPFAVAAAIKRWKDVEMLVIAIGLVVAIGTALTVGGLIFGYGGTYSILGATRAYWEQPWDSSMEPLTSLCLPFLFAAVLFGRRSVSHYWLICGLFVACLVGLVLTFSRESWLLGFCGLLLISAIWLRKRVNPALGLILVVVASVTIILSGVIGLASTFYDPNAVYGFERIYYYATALRLFATHPVLGVGAGNYQFFDRSYEGAAAGGIAHNQFLTMAAETGIVGLSMFFWLIVAIFRVRRHLRFSLDSLGGSYEWVKVGGSVFLLLWMAECFFQEAFFATAAAGGGMHVMTVIVFPWMFLGILLAACNLSQPLQT
jgi:O-antigen ligase